MITIFMNYMVKSKVTAIYNEIRELRKSPEESPRVN